MPKPVSELAGPLLGRLDVAAIPTSGQGLALDELGRVNAALLKDFPNDAAKALLGDGTWGSIGTSYRKVTEKDVVNTTTETDLLNGEITVAAGVMGTNKTLRAHLAGDLLNNGGANPTLRLKIKLGTTTIFDEITSTLVADADRFPWSFAFEVTNLGSASSQWIDGVFSLGHPVAATTGIGDFAGAMDATVPNVDGGNIWAFASSSSVSTAVAALLEVTVTWSTANANQSFRLKRALVEIV